VTIHINVAVEVNVTEVERANTRTTVARDYQDEWGIVAVVPVTETNGVVLRVVTSDRLGKAFIRFSEAGARELMGALQQRYPT
jgi:hypothetical protein